MRGFHEVSIIERLFYIKKNLTLSVGRHGPGQNIYSKKEPSNKKAIDFWVPKFEMLTVWNDVGTALKS
jgi:hypothetical protein